MSNLEVLISESDGYSEKALSILSNFGNVRLENYSQLELEQNISDFDVLVVRLNLIINRNILNKARRLKFILSPTTGIDHIDVKEAQKKGIQIICLKGEEQFLKQIPSTAEHTWALLLSLIRHIPASFDHVKRGGWNRQIYRGYNLSRKNLGILGFGRVGSQVANFAQSFGCNVGAFDPYKKHLEASSIIRFERVEDLLKWNDILCIHVPYNVENHHFLNFQLLSSIKRQAILINTSRGGVWDEEAVVKLLVSGQLSGVATDVLENELDPIKRQNNPLIKYSLNNENIIITPHLAGATYESMKMTEEFIAMKFSQIIM